MVDKRAVSESKGVTIEDQMAHQMQGSSQVLVSSRTERNAREMILLQSASRFLLQVLLNRVEKEI
ncbi:hypothetical protein C5167_034107 [Papaver somniferum]|uniref:Uncharacterized protein n=1 Tax=Papaver somniferum TaxID=3469 RepID=A0A4Y7KF13_PAPSO|nr:hypothetical protein C5167_034107 [Papaver somniferum]